MIEYRVEDDIAILSFNQAGATNVINQETMKSFGEKVLEIKDLPNIKGIIITSSKKAFMVGADLNMIIQFHSAEEIMNLTMQLHQLLRGLETCGKPVVAAINGTAVGGGYEICLACHHRIAVNDSKIEIGLPEVMLGLLPGGGGTQRLPRLIGIQTALQLILEGKKVRPQEAKALGLVDQLVDKTEDLIPAAKKWILEVGKKVQPWDEKGFKIPGGAVMSKEGAMIFTAGAALLRKKTYGNYPATQAIMSAIYEGLQLPFDRALTVEARYFTKCALSKESKHMIRTLWFTKNAADKGEVRPKNIPEKEIKKIGVLGAGMMGAGIAYVSANSGIQVILKDVTKEKAEAGKQYSVNLLNEKLKKGYINSQTYQEILDRIITTDKAEDLAGCDLIVEAVFEDRALKAKVTQESEAVNGEDCIFASNTSTLPITGLAEASQRPENFIGLHFFSPVDKMPLVEIIMGKQTSEKALAYSIDFIKKIKKTPIVVNDGRGFYTSRVFATYVKEGIALLAEGVPPAMIENAGKAAGMPVAPLALADEVSIELLYHIVKQTEKDLGITITDPAAELGRLFVEKLGRLGKKNKKGFYDYPDNGKKKLWDGLKEYYPPKPNAPDYETCKKRLLYVQSLEAVKCLEENILTRPEDGDLGSILGWGFAPFTGGVLSYIEYVGLNEFIQNCQKLEAQFGERFKVPNLLLQMQKENRLFYNNSVLTV